MVNFGIWRGGRENLSLRETNPIISSCVRRAAYCEKKYEKNKTNSNSIYMEVSAHETIVAYLHDVLWSIL